MDTLVFISVHGVVLLFGVSERMADHDEGFTSWYDFY